MVARRITSLRSLPARLSSLHSGNCSLLALFFGSSPFRISNLQSLFAKHPGWGYPNASAPSLASPPHMRHVAPLSPVRSFDYAYFPSPRGVPAHTHQPLLPAHRTPLLTPLLTITSLQTKQFHAITHSFSQRQPCISPIFGSTLLMSVGGVSPRRSKSGLGYDRSRAATTEALWCAMASMEIMGFTPEALGNVEPSMT
jgi:hypothetical protein